MCISLRAELETSRLKGGWPCGSSGLIWNFVQFGLTLEGYPSNAMAHPMQSFLSYTHSIMLKLMVYLFDPGKLALTKLLLYR